MYICIRVGIKTRRHKAAIDSCHLGNLRIKNLLLGTSQLKFLAFSNENLSKSRHRPSGVRVCASAAQHLPEP